MNIFDTFSKFLLVFLAAGPWLLPEVSKYLSLKQRILLTSCILILLLLLATYSRILGLLKKMRPRLREWIQALIRRTTHPLARIIYVLLLLGAIALVSDFDTRVIYLSLGVLFIFSTSIKWLPVRKVAFSDTFDSGLGSWDIVTGNPGIDDQFGNPAPSLGLNPVSGVKTHCFLELLLVETPNRGTIECDVYLEPGTIFNVVFRADLNSERWYMARLDTRDGYKDGFLKDNGDGWLELRMSGSNSSARTWHRVKVELDGSKAKLFRDGRLLAEMDDPDFKSGKIGIFNEVAEVHVDNLTVSPR